MSQLSLDIVLPCYNPQQGWTQTVINSWSKICNALSDTKVNLIIVDDGSTGMKPADVEMLKEKIPSLRVEQYEVNRGKGYAVRKGVSIANGDVVIYTDIDFPYEEADLIAIYNSFKKPGCDIALGKRNEDYYREVPASRKIISRFLKRLIQFTLKVPTTDTQAGLKGFNKRGKEIFLKTTINRYLFDLEFIWLAAKQKEVSIQLVPVRVKEGLHFSKMNWKVLLKEGLNFLRIFFRSPG